MNCSEANVTHPLSRARERVGVREDAKDKARELRGQMTEAETLLWQLLKGRRFQGFKFRRRRPLGPYILDFVCLEAGLVIESQGLTVIRFWNHEVMKETPAVLEKIWQTLQTLTPALSRKRERE